MSKRVLIDTNLLILAINADSIFHKKSIYFLLYFREKFFTISKSISEYLVDLTRTESIKIKTDTALELAQQFTAYLDKLYLIILSYDIYFRLLTKYKPSGLRIHDFEISSIGSVHSVKSVATTIYPPFPILRKLKL